MDAPGDDQQQEGLDLHAQVDKAMGVIAPAALEGPALVTGWCVVVEAIDQQGHPQLVVLGRAEQPYWRSLGMLTAAHDQIRGDAAYSEWNGDEESSS
jgi:hypothetical protein